MMKDIILRMQAVKWTIIRNTKNWWAQSEGLNTLMIFSEIYPNDKHNYFAKVQKALELFKHIPHRS